MSNPLKSYFRKPALYLKLPSKGIGYKENAIDLPESGEIPIFPMTALDEITTRTPDALFNGQAVVEIIHSCAPNIKDPWQLLQIDLDPILLAIKIATNGSTMEILTVCPNCNHDAKYDVNLTGMLNEFSPGDYNKLYPVYNDVQIKFKPLTYTKVNENSQKQFDLQRAYGIISKMEEGADKENKMSELVKEMNEIATELILEIVEYVKTPESVVIEKEYIKEFLENIPKKEYDNIKDQSINLRKTTEAKPLAFTCPSCSHNYEQPFDLNISDFFV